MTFQLDCTIRPVNDEENAPAILHVVNTTLGLTVAKSIDLASAVADIEAHLQSMLAAYRQGDAIEEGYYRICKG